jgi:DNA-binding HxlR family transcriptional regulator
VAVRNERHFFRFRAFGGSVSTYAMPRDDRRSGCPIAISLDMFGDRWSLLIVRDLMFKGYRSFKEFAAAGEGIATNILADRLERLEAAGIIEGRANAEDGRKGVYRLTAKGIDLAPVLTEMVIWAARHERTDAPAATVRAMRRNRTRFLAGVRKRLRAAPQPPAKAR